LDKIKIYGLGGQGAVTIGKIICHACCCQQNKYAKALPAYGHERRGGLVSNDVIVDEEPILINSFIYNPNVVVALSENIDEIVSGQNGIQNTAVLALNSSYPPAKYISCFSKCYYVNATELSLNILGKNIPNIGMLGILAHIGIVSMDALKATIDDLYYESSAMYKNLLESAYNETHWM